MTNEQIKKQLNDFEVLFLTVVGEARGEPVEGQIAVANVIMNRAKKSKKGVKDACLAHKQFSCWNTNDSNRLLLERLTDEIMRGHHNFEFYRQIQYVVGGVYEGKINDNTKKSLNYMTTKLFRSDDRPDWAKIPSTEPFEIGNHTFFTA